MDHMYVCGPFYTEDCAIWTSFDTNCLETFLADFVSEMSELNKNGFMCSQCEGTTNLPVALHSMFCDAPGRAFIKNIKGHNSLNACECCKALVMYHNNRTVFTSESCFQADE